METIFVTTINFRIAARNSLDPRVSSAHGSTAFPTLRAGHDRLLATNSSQDEGHHYHGDTIEDTNSGETKQNPDEEYDGSEASRCAGKTFYLHRNNGAGKSTLVRQVLAGKLPVVNADEIAAAMDLANRNSLPVVLAALRQAHADREAYLGRRQSFGFETVLAGDDELGLMNRAKAAGYRINLFYVGVNVRIDSADLQPPSFA